MSLTGTPKPTFFYPRFIFGTPAVTLDIPEPAMAILPQPVPTVGLAGENRVASGKAEILFGRLEEQCGLVLRCEADMLQALRWMCEDSVFRGHQFQAWIDRYTGSCWMFENTLKDQNGLALTFAPSGTPTYATGSTGTGVVLSGTNYLTVALAQASAGTITGYDDPLLKDEGVILVDFLPSFAGNDGVSHLIVDMTGTPNKVQIGKSAANVLYVQVVDTASAVKTQAAAVTWSSGTRVQIVASWTTAGVVTGWYATAGGSFTSLATASGAGTGLITTMPSTLYLGADNAGTQLAPGTYDTVAIFKMAFPNPLMLAGYRPWRRNYFPYGEVLQRQFAPTRVSFARPIDDWPILFRNGKP